MGVLEWNGKVRVRRNKKKQRNPLGEEVKMEF